MLPNKIISVADSLIWKLPYILDIVMQGELTVTNLFSCVARNFEDANEFILCLGCVSKRIFERNVEYIYRGTKNGNCNSTL